MGLFFDDKPGKNKVSKNLDLDDDLSFDFDSLDDGLDMFDEGNKRTPIEKFKSGIRAGVKSELSNPSTYKKLVLDALPNEYKTVNREVERRYRDLTRIYKDTTGSLKEELSSLSEQIGKLVPEDQGVARKLYDATLGKFKGKERFSYDDDRNYNQEEIDNVLKEVFKSQNRANKRKEAIDSIRTGLSYKGTLDSIELLTSIDSNTSALRGYQDSVTQAYQKKSLELQYRSYFVQAELLKKFNEYSNEDLAIGKSIIKNTSLPDFVKATDSEKIGDVFMTKFGDKIYSKLFNNDFIGGLTKSLSDKAQEMVEQIKAGIFAASMVEDTPDGFSDLAGRGVGALGTSIVQDIASKATKNIIGKSPRVNEFLQGKGKKLHNVLITNPEGYIQDLIDKKLGFNFEDGNIKSFLKEFFSDVLSNSLSGTGTSLEDVKSFSDLNKPSIYSNKAHLSITEVIPGYLSKMLRELTILRTGDSKTPDILFDYSTSKFSDSNKLGDKYTGLIRDQLGSGHRGALDSLVSTIAPDSKDNVKNELNRFLSNVSQERMVYSPENIRNTEHYSKLSTNARNVIDSYFKSIEGTGSKVGVFERRMGQLRTSINDPRGIFEEAIKSGHGEVLERLGLIQKAEDGTYSYDINNYIKESISDDPIGNIKKGNIVSNLASKISNTYNRFKNNIGNKEVTDGKTIPVNIGLVKLDDGSISNIVDPLIATFKEVYNQPISVTIDDKELIRPIDTGFSNVVSRLDTIIERISNISVTNRSYNYNGKDFFNGIKDMDYSKVLDVFKVLKSYKLPQSVIDYFVNAYSEGRITLDEIIEELNESFSDLKEASGSRFSTIYNRLRTGLGIGLEKLTDIGRNLPGTIGNVARSTMTVGKSIFDFISSKASENKDPIYNAMRGILGTMLEFSKNALDVGKDILFNKLPIGVRAGYEKIRSLSKSVNNFYLATDVYVKGESEPRLTSRLLRNGYYILRDTGEAIYSFKDIKGTIVDPEGNVVLSTEDIKLGLVDKDGNELSTPFEKLLSATGTFIRGGINRLGKFFNNFEFSIPNIFNAFNSYNDKVVNVLVEIRNILLAKFGMSNDGYDDYDIGNIDPDTPSGPSSPNSSLLNSIKNLDVGRRTNEFGSLLKRTAGNIGGKFMSGIGTFFNRDTTDTEETDTNKPSIKDKLLNVLNAAKTTTSNVIDRTKNTYKERLKRLDEENKDRHKFVETEVTSRYDKGDGILGTIQNMFSYIKDFFSVSGFAGFLGGVLSKVPVLGPLLGKLGGMIGLGKTSDLVGPPNPFGKPKGAVGTIRGLGSKAIGALGTVAGFGAKTLARGALALTGLGLSGVASAATTALTGTISAMGAIGAAILSPIGLAVIGTGLAAYGAYKVYKYLTDGKLNEFEKVRYLQYGIDPENETHIAKIPTIGSLEEYLMEEGIVINRDTVSLSPNIDAKKVLEIAGIELTNDNVETYNRWADWFNVRFKPVFLKHSIAINKVKLGNKLKDISKLNDTDKVTYLSLITDGISNVYSYLEAPYQDMDPLVNKHVMIDLLVKRLILDLKKSGAKPVTSNVEKLKKEIATKETQQKLVNQNQNLLMTQKRKEDIPKPNPNTVDRSLLNSSSVASRSSIYTVATNDNTTIPEGDGSSNETSVKLDGLGNVPISKELRIASGPLRDGSMASKYITVSKPSVTLDGLDPTVLQMLTGMIEEYGEITGKKVIITDGFRSYQEQARLYAKDSNKAAPPGRSLHEFGLAVDIDRRNLNEMDSLGLMRKYGFTRPVGGEPWHIEPAGIQADINRAKQDVTFRNQAISSSIGKGGGGYGTVSSSIIGRRNDEIAKSLFTATASNVNPSDIMNGVKQNVTSNTDSKPTPIATFNKDNNNQWSMSAPTDNKVTDGSTVTNIPNNLDESISKDLADVKVDPNLVSTIDNASQKIGVDTTKMLTLAAVESDFKPSARAGTSSAKGLFQFIDSTYRETAPSVGLSSNSNPNDPYNSALVGAKYTKDNERVLGKMGVGTGTFESYLAHFLGPGGAKILLRANDNEIAAKLLPKAAMANKSIFFNGNSPRTVQGVKEEIRNRLVSKARRYNIPLDNSLSNSNIAGNMSNVTSDTNVGTVSNDISDNTPIYDQQPVRPSFRADNAIIPAAVSNNRAEIDTTSENYSKVIASSMDISISLQENMLTKLTSIDDTLMKALTDIVTSKKTENMNRYREELKPSIDLTRSKAV